MITSQLSFGKLIAQGLIDTGEYQVEIFTDFAEAIAYTRDASCQLAFLDADAQQISLVDLGRALRKARPLIKLVIFDSDDESQSYKDLEPYYLLKKPFFLNDLLSLMEEIFPTDESAMQQEDLFTVNEVPWLRDVNRAAQHLMRLTLESSAQAALIASHGELWAYAGQLSQKAANELAETVARYTDKEDRSDLLRFVRLASTGADHMLYATRLGQDLYLTLVFDAETPFSTIRGQANLLAKSLFSPPETVEGAPPSGSKAHDNYPEMPSIADLLSDVPPPDPDIEDKKPPQKKSEGSTFSKETSPAVPFSRLLSKISREQPPPVILDTSLDVEQPADSPEPDEDETMEVTMESREEPSPQTVEVPDEDEEESPSEPYTRPRSVTEVAQQRIVLEPVSPALYNLTYSCLLIPRFPSHHLVGQLAGRLTEWVQNICIAFGWRLEYMTVRPDYLQWIVNVPPATSPAYLMRIIRQQTSERILAEFPGIKHENPSGDFWAPGYLIMGGSQPHPHQLVKDFIKQTRQRQGIGTGPLR